jgi:hypothetical protein
MDRITIFDTSIASDNLGDEIIMQTVDQVIMSNLPRAYPYQVATHEYMSWVSRRLASPADRRLEGTIHWGRIGLMRDAELKFRHRKLC